MERKSYMKVGGCTMLENGKTVEEAKKELLERMMETIKEAAQDDRFWIVKEDSVGWKMGIPQWEIEKRVFIGVEDISDKAFGGKE